MSGFSVAALYHFAPILDPAARQVELKQLCEQYGVCGTLLLAKEGINGTIASDDVGIREVIAHITSLAEI